MPDWLVSFLAGILGALIGAAGVLSSKAIGIRFQRRKATLGRESDTARQIRENAGWVKTQLVGYRPFSDYQDELRSRITRLEELRAVFAHHRDIDRRTMEFAHTAGIMWARQMEFSNSGEGTELRGQVSIEYEALIAALGSVLR